MKKKSLNVSEIEKKVISEIEIREPSISAKASTDNFNILISKKLEQFQLNNSILASKPLTQDVTLQVSGAVVTGTSIKSLEFDINIKSTNSLSFLDNMPVWLTYNPSVFGVNVVANGKVTITNGANFATSQYLSANSNKTDQTTNTLAFAVGTDYLLSSPVRVNITPTYKLLAHVKIEVSNCGTASINLSNASTAINAAFYTTTSAASSSSFVNYTTLNYLGSGAGSIACLPTIINFQSPIRGGIDTLKIKGYAFGTSKGTGEVQFKNADINTFPYITVLDASDYISWTDTLIKILMPSTNNILTLTNGISNTPGTGSFIVKNNLGQTITSTNNSLGQPFKVLFALQASLSAGVKPKIHIVGNGPDNNYILYCDSSAGKHPKIFNIIKKAARDWGCLTTLNIDVVYDSTIVDGLSINYFKFSNFATMDPSIAKTSTQAGTCPITNHRAIINFDMDFKRNQVWQFDTTSTPLPALADDFYAVILHELGHSMGILHIIDPLSVMYYEAQYVYTGSIPYANLRRLKPYTAEVDAGLFKYQVV